MFSHFWQMVGQSRMSLDMMHIIEFLISWTFFFLFIITFWTYLFNSWENWTSNYLAMCHGCSSTLSYHLYYESFNVFNATKFNFWLNCLQWLLIYVLCIQALCCCPLCACFLFPTVPLELFFPLAMGLFVLANANYSLGQIDSISSWNKSKCFGTNWMFSPIRLHNSIGPCSYDNGLKWPSFGLY
jgi:hypothetical protein